jgi:hypothetical protein
MQADGFPKPEQQPTMSVEEAGGWIALSRPSAYKAAARGDIPTIRIGRRLVVPTAALRRLLQLDSPADRQDAP